MSKSSTICFSLILNAGDANIQVLPSVPDRLLLVLKNTGVNPIILGIGSDASAGYILAAGEVLKIENPDACPNSFVQASSALGASLAVISVVSAASPGRNI